MSFLKIRFKHQRLAEKLKSNEKKVKRRLVCESCDLKFLTWWEIWEHWKSTGHKQPESCRWCSKKTFTLQSHLCKQHWSLASMCPFCGQLFMFVEDMERHRLSHDGKTYRCYHCGRRRRNEEILREHVLTHYHEDRYGCSLCEKRFKKKKTLERHLKEVHCQCPYCGINTENEAALKIHAKEHSDLTCVHCHKTFSQKNRLKYHYQIKHGDQDVYRCNQCPKRYAIKSRLLNHIALVHKGKAKYRCRYCRLGFLYRQPYLNHVAGVHTKSVPTDMFICRYCGFSTDRKVKLRWHVEGTSGKGFECRTCNVRQECRGLYEKHLNTHSNEKWRLFFCGHCPRGFGSETTLRHHVSWKHPEVVMAEHPRGFPCLEPMCNKYYITRSSLARHLRRNHGPDASAHPSLRQRGRGPKGSGVQTRGKGSSAQTRGKGSGAQTRGKENRPARGPATTTERPRTRQQTRKLKSEKEEEEVDVLYCNICKKIWFSNTLDFKRHLSTHGEKVWHDRCEECELVLDSPEEAVRHFTEVHLDAEFVPESEVN